MTPVRCKICGITRVEDALTAAAAGVDAIGLVFHPASPRAVSLDQAQAIVEALPPFVTTVGLFVDRDPADIAAVLQAVPLDLLQFHGSETAAQCEGYGRPYIKALAVRPGVDLVAEASSHPRARGILLDTYWAGQTGGTGRTFDWSLVPTLPLPLILAGGLTPANVGEAIRRTHPWAVDVSGGVEKGKGVKDPELMAAFVRRVRTIEAF